MRSNERTTPQVILTLRCLHRTSQHHECYLAKRLKRVPHVHDQLRCLPSKTSKTTTKQNADFKQQRKQEDPLVEERQHPEINDLSA